MKSWLFSCHINAAGYAVPVLLLIKKSHPTDNQPHLNPINQKELIIQSTTTRPQSRTTYLGS
jgi:hypothetical protein